MLAVLIVFLTAALASTVGAYVIMEDYRVPTGAAICAGLLAIALWALSSVLSLEYFRAPPAPPTIELAPAATYI
jgi:hypothetical protein